MIAASALVVAVLASYAGIGMLSLAASTSLPAFTSLPGVEQIVTGIGWQKQDLHKLIRVGRNTPSSVGGALADVTSIAFGQVRSAGGQRQVSIANHSSAPLELTVQVHGASGVNATFAGGVSSATVQPHQAATVNVQSSASYAGPFTAQLEISAKGLTSVTVPITGDQAPLPAGAVTATPAAGGAVKLSWTPSQSVSGVAGYLVQRSGGGGATFQQVGGLTTTTSAVDHTPSDGSYSYRIVAVADGGAALQSDPGPVGTVTSDSAPPDVPQSVSGPQFINLKNADSVPVTVDLPSTSSPADTVTVTLTGPAGATATASGAGGGSSVTIPVNAQGVADGKVTASATASDSLGNVSAATAPTSITKDTVPPGAPGPLSSLPLINNQNETSYSFPVEVGAPSASTDTLRAVFMDQNGTTVSGTGSAADGTIAMQDLSGLADGPIKVSVSSTDAAGNQSDKTSATVTKQATPPVRPTDFGVAAGPNNPAGVVTPQSASAVTITAAFAQAPAADDTIVVFANHHQVATATGDGQTTTFSFGPFDFSDLQPGTYKLGMMQTDGVGNQTWMPGSFTVDGGPSGPGSVGVPAGPENPAGYVNAATQTAATIVATFAAPTDPADQIALSVGGLDLGTQSGGGDSISWTGDLSSLPDGTLQILGTITDQNGVTTTFSGSLIKDTTPPPAPAVAGVAGPPPNVITPGNASCVNVGVAFNQALDPSDTVTATLSDGSTSVQGTAQAGDGQATVGCIDASSLAAGPVSVTVTVTDLAGNSVTFTGTPAVKVGCHQNKG